MLSPEQIARFHTQGYLVVENILPKDLLGRIRAEYAALLDGLLQEWGLDGLRDQPFEKQLIEAYRQGQDWFQPLDISLPGDAIAPDTPMHFGPAVFDMVTCPNVLDAVQSLIGPEITSNPIQHVRIKPPVPDLRADEIRAHIAETDWHQDRAVALAEADQTEMVTVWLAITDATLENGCLQVVPLNDNQEMLPHCPKTQTAIADGYLDVAQARPLPVPAGGAVLFHPLVPHSSLQNRSQNIRWSFDLRYNRSGHATGRSQFPEFIARSASHPNTALKDWRLWRQMWQEARSRCACAEHIELHRWRSDAPTCA